MTDSQYLIVKFYSNYDNKVSVAISNEAIDQFSDWPTYQESLNSSVSKGWLIGGFGFETGISQKGRDELSIYESKKQREIEIAELNFKKLKYDVRNSARIFKTYWWTFAIAVFGFIISIVLLILKLTE